MGWALRREDNEVTNEKDEREGKPVARQLAPMISKFIRTQWESEELEGVDADGDLGGGHLCGKSDLHVFTTLREAAVIQC
jgi:hypothetical protein